MIVNPVIFAVQMVVALHKITLAAMLNFAQQDCQGQVLTEDAGTKAQDADPAEDADLRQQLLHGLTQSQKVRWSSR